MIRRILHRRFQLQLLFALVATVSVSLLAIGLVINAVRHAEGFVLTDTERQLDHAVQQLERQSETLRGSSRREPSPPPPERDEAFYAIAQSVLNTYAGVEGGFWVDSEFWGYAFPTHDGPGPKRDVPPAERPFIEEVIRRAITQGTAEQTLRGRQDFVVIVARATRASGEPSAEWAMKRLPRDTASGAPEGGWLLALVAFAALPGAAGVLATAIGLSRGIAQITGGLATLDRDLHSELPLRSDELGQIASAINGMTRARRRLEAEIRREDRIRTMGRLVGRIAHEMRNPLNSMRLSLQMLSQRHEQGRLKTADFAIAVAELDRINRLLSDLLAFQQPRPPRMMEQDVVPVLRECIATLSPEANQKRVHLTVDGEPELTAELDTEYVRQIVINLVVNAIDVSPSGGEVRVRAAAVDGGVRIEVADQGPGLDADQQEHLFEPFYTTKLHGHGMGLALSRELAQSMRGALHWRNLPNGGAAFVLELRRNS